MINTTFFKYFFDAATNGSILKAAEINFVTPASISGGIKKLEDIYQIQLLEHKRKAFQLTPHGHYLLKKMPDLIMTIENFEKQIRSGDYGLSGEIMLGTTNSLATTLLPSAMEKLNKLHPDISVKIRIGTPPEIREWLADGEIDLGLTIQRKNLSKFNEIVIHEGRFFIVKSGNCKSKDIIVTEHWPEVVSFEKVYLKKFNTPCPIILRAPSWTLVKQFVEKGVYQGLLPDFLIDKKMSKQFTKLNTESYKIIMLGNHDLREIDKFFISLFSPKQF